MRRRKLKTDHDIEVQAGVTRRDPIAVRVGRMYSREQIRKVEQQIVPWYRGSKENEDRKRL